MWITAKYFVARTAPPVDEIDKGRNLISVDEGFVDGCDVGWNRRQSTSAEAVKHTALPLPDRTAGASYPGPVFEFVE
jgi:hypothetical protein